MKYFSALSVLLHGALLLTWPTMETAPRHTGQDTSFTISLAPRSNNNAMPAPPVVHSSKAAQRLPPQAEKPHPKSVKKQLHSDKSEQDTTRSPARPVSENIPGASLETEKLAHIIPLNDSNIPAPAKPAPIAGTSRDNHTPDRLSRPHTAAVKNDIQNSLRQAITPYFHYPSLAQRRGWQGVVELGVQIDANGHLGRIWIKRSSGHRILDKAAEKALYQVTTIPDIDSNINGHDLEMVLPVEYRLIDS